MKRTLAFLLTIVLVLGLTTCGDEKTSPQTPETETQTFALDELAPRENLRGRKRAG